MKLDNKMKSALKAQAHHLKPVVRVGQHGLTENVIKETDNALTTHELIKVHIQDDDRDVRVQAATDLAEKNKAILVHHIGKIFILYRKNIVAKVIEPKTENKKPTARKPIAKKPSKNVYTEKKRG